MQNTREPRLASRDDPVRSVLHLVLTLAAVYLLLCVVMFARQRKLVYFPGPAPAANPGDHGLAFDELELSTADGEVLHAWRVRARGGLDASESVAPGAPVGGGRGTLLVVHCHGNAGNMENRIPVAGAFAAMGFDCLLFDYRGYGRSSGSPTEQGLYQDALAAYEWARSAGYAPGAIAVFGESLGAAVAVELARLRPVAGVVLENAFTSLPDMGAALYPWLPVRLLARDRFDSLAKVPELAAPILALHGRADEIVPFALGQRLAAAAKAELVELPGGHNSGGFLQTAHLMEKVRAFLERAFAAPSLRSNAPAK